MAEQVQAVLDRMVPAFVDFQERGILSPNEVTQIVARRRNSEYALRRRSPRLTDFIAYITAETVFLRLVQLREQKWRRTQKAAAARAQAAADDNADALDKDDGPSNSAKSQALSKPRNNHVLQHVHLLWVRTLRKYRSQVDLYLQYAQFCKEQQSMTRLAACYQEALRFHASHIPLWIEAASFEYFGNNSIAAARILLQRAIRLYPSNAELWLQRFTLELHAAQKLRGRKQILLATGSNSKKRDGVVVDDSESEATDDGYKIALIVFDHGVTAVVDTAAAKSPSSSSESSPKSVQWRLECLRTCAQFPDTRGLEEHIVQSLQRDCAQSPTAWIARALYEQQQQQHGRNGPGSKRPRLVDSDVEPGDNSHNDNESDAVLDIIREACDSIRTEPMVLYAVDFLSQYAQFKLKNQREHAVEDPEDGTEAVDGDNDLVPKCVAPVHALIRALFADAIKWDVYHDKLALPHADYLTSFDVILDYDDGPIAVLKQYMNRQRSSQTPPSAAVWIRWASLENSEEGSGIEKAIDILQRACRKFPMHEPDHVAILGQLFCAYVHDDKNDSHPRFDTLQQLLILSANSRRQPEVEYPVVSSLPNVVAAVRQYLLYSNACEDVLVYRKNCDALLSSTHFFTQGAGLHTDDIRLLLEDMIDVETRRLESQENASKTKAAIRPIQAQQRLTRLYDKAIETFHGKFPDLADEFRQLKADKMLYKGNRNRSGGNQPYPSFDVPLFDMTSPDFDIVAMEQMYRDFQIVLVKNAGKARRNKDDSKATIHWRDVGNIFQNLVEKDKASWSIETMTTGNDPISPVEFLAAEVTPDRAYCSFLIQNDTKSYNDGVERLPFQEFPLTTWEYEPALWVFFCRNPLGHEAMDGRPEHTDAITHDGTWHFQLSGKKRWLIRATAELNNRLSDLGLPLPSPEALQVDCDEGDVIVVNTKLWFHHTVIPPQGRPSVSYARDFSMGNNSLVGAASKVGGMTNLDGLYATNDIAEGTIIFTESDLPDCEIHRSSTDPNCEVVPLADGTNALVSTMAISAGEFFAMAESSEDEGSQEEDGESEGE